MDAVILLVLVLMLLLLIYFMDKIFFVLKKMGEYEAADRDRQKVLIKNFDDVIQAIVLNRKAETEPIYPKSKLKPIVKTDADLYEAELERGKK